MFRRKMSEQELRMWCIEQISRHCYPSRLLVDELYDYVISGEPTVVQKTPHGCFFCRLLSRIQNLLK